MSKFRRFSRQRRKFLKQQKTIQSASFIRTFVIDRVGAEETLKIATPQMVAYPTFDEAAFVSVVSWSSVIFLIHDQNVTTPQTNIGVAGTGRCETEEGQEAGEASTQRLSPQPRRECGTHDAPRRRRRRRQRHRPGAVPRVRRDVQPPSAGRRGPVAPGRPEVDGKGKIHSQLVTSVCYGVLVWKDD